MDKLPKASGPADLSALPILRYFSYAHLTGDLRDVARACEQYASGVVAYAEAALDRGEYVDMAELVAGLRKLLEAKDCFVRARLPQR